jgi:hypothetical protein
MLAMTLPLTKQATHRQYRIDDNLQKIFPTMLLAAKCRNYDAASGNGLAARIDEVVLQCLTHAHHNISIGQIVAMADTAAAAASSAIMMQVRRISKSLASAPSYSSPMGALRVVQGIKHVKFKQWFAAVALKVALGLGAWRGDIVSELAGLLWGQHHEQLALQSIEELRATFSARVCKDQTLCTAALSVPGLRAATFDSSDCSASAVRSARLQWLVSHGATGAAPAVSWKMKNTTGCANATAFFESQKQTATVYGFNGIGRARQAAGHQYSRYGGHGVRHYRGEAGGRGANAFVKFTKLPSLHQERAKQWAAYKKEYQSLHKA